MRIITTTLTTIAIAAAVAACGSGSASTTASGTTATQGETTTAQLGAGATASATKEQQLATRAQTLLGQMATATGALATGNTSGQQQARQTLSSLQTRLDTLAANARRRLPAGNPARLALAQTAKSSAKAANELRHMTINPATERRLRNVQGTLQNLSQSVGGLDSSSSGTSVHGLAKLTEELGRLQLQLTGSGSGLSG